MKDWKPRNLEEAMQLIMPSVRSTEHFDRTGYVIAERIKRIVKPSDKILDFGCGIGRVLKYLPNAIGYEPNLRMRELAKEWTSKTILSSIENFENYFDIVLDISVFLYLEEDELREACKLCNKVLKNDGLLISNADLNLPYFQKTKSQGSYSIYVKKKIT